MKREKGVCVRERERNKAGRGRERERGGPIGKQGKTKKDEWVVEST